MKPHRVFYRAMEWGQPSPTFGEAAGALRASQAWRRAGGLDITVVFIVPPVYFSDWTTSGWRVTWKPVKR